MKTILPAGIYKVGSTLILLLMFHGFAWSQASAPLRFGNSYVNLTKKSIGGPVDSGDVLEIRTVFYINSTYNGSGYLYKIRYLDSLPTHTAITDSLRIITNEGLTMHKYTLATGDDAGSYMAAPGAGGYQIRINMGDKAGGVIPTTPAGVGPMTTTNVQGAGTLRAGKSKPLFSSSSIFTAAFRVVVTGHYGDTIVLGPGKVIYRTKSTSTTDTILNSVRYKILIQKPTTLCTSSTSTNFAAESGGTFGTGTTHDRSTGPTYLIPNYNYLSTTGTTNPINDGYYGIVNNTSPTSSTVTNASFAPNCTGTGTLSCSNREFDGFWYIGGDHTGTTTAAGNAPAAAGANGGYMLLVNADLATSEAYHQVITGLCPNTYYQFSAWFKNVCPNCGIDSNGTATHKPGVLPNLTLVIDSIYRISTGQLDTVGWQQRGFVFQTGPTQTSITISIRNNAPGGGGNDWALDDISLATCPPNLTLTPNRPDTLCQGGDDTVRFAISSYVNNYNNYALQKSTDGGATWVAAGLDTLNRKDTGTAVPVYNALTGLYQDTVTRYYRIAPTDQTILYRIIVASTVDNLTTTGCYYITSQIKTVVGVNCMTILPTTLLSFHGQVKSGLASLEWTTANELSGMSYLVSRSDDGKVFSTVATVKGTGGDGGSGVYQLVDPNAVGSATYYRITLVSNSASRFSNLVLLSNNDMPLAVRSFINPFVDNISVELTTPGDGLVTLTLVDMYGRYVRRTKNAVGQGLNTLNMYGLGGLPPGTYALQIQYNDQLISKKLVKIQQ